MLARYARAIAYYRIPDLARALPAIDGLIREFPNNPYYRELKGQMLFENGRGREAIRPYEDAVRLAPSAGRCCGFPCRRSISRAANRH